MYQAITEVLQRLDAPETAAEMHGLLSGFLCAVKDRSDTSWVDHLIAHCAPPDSETEAQCRKVLLSLQVYVLNQFDSEDLSFAPLLPDDSRPLALRSQALGLWCQGFTYGLGLGGIKDTGTLSGAAREFVDDALQLARLSDASPEDDPDGEEHAYMQLFEYVRVGVMTVYEESRRTTPKPAVLH